MSNAGNAQLPRPGDTIAGKYVLDRLLGQGGMGAVFAAKHIKLSKAVAIKIMLADTSNPEAAQRFINEGRAAANIQNEHVVRVDDVDEEMGYAYMVLELLDGEDLAQVLERDAAKRLQPQVVVGYVLQALRGVAQAHAIGIVHRDLKPSNLFLARRKDGTVVVKVLDFGISKAQGSSALAASPSALTSTKAMLGSPLYMSPEQLRSSKSVDHRADIWAMGVILYELMTGHLPFMGDNLGELFAAILETDPTPIRARSPEVPPGLEEVVMRCLQRKPENRYGSATELADALAPFASGATAGAPLHGTALLAPGAAAAALAASGFPLGAVTPNPSHPNLGAVTPNPSSMQRPPLPSGGANTGSGPRQVAGGTVAIGSSTPQGMMMSTGSGWQNTASGSATLPKAKPPVALLAIAGFLLLAIGGVALMFLVRKPKTDPTGGGSSIAATSPPPPPPSAILTVPTPSETASVASATPSATAPAPTTTTPAATVAAAQPKGPQKTPPKADPPKTADTPAVKPPAPKPTGDNMQTNR
jgi:serine/threonine protein kinase